MMHTRYFDLRDTKGQQKIIEDQISACLLYTSDAADE